MAASRDAPRIIVFNMNFIGDVLFTTPALAALRRGYPEASLTVAVGPRAREVLAANPDVDRVIDFAPNWEFRRRLLPQLRRERFDIAFSFSARDIERALWGCLLGCRQRWGFSRPETRWLYSGHVKENEQQHWAADYLALACAAGGQAAGMLPRFYLTPAEEAWAERTLADAGVDPGRFLLGLHMGASYPEKAWLPERFEELARLAARDRDAQVVVFGGEGEAALGEWLKERVPNALNLAGTLTLRQFAATARRCAAFVGGDSGPTHVAAALGVSTVGLFGFTDPVRTGTLGARATVLTGLQRNGDRNAQRRQQSPYQWLAPITSAEVWDAACRLSASS